MKVGVFRLFKNVKNRCEFMQRVQILWDDAYEDRELEEFPTSVFGGFAPWRIDEFLRLARLHPEYHVVTCIEPSLYINSFTEGGQAYYLGEGDTDPKLIHDPYAKLDLHLLHSLNSGRSRRIA